MRTTRPPLTATTSAVSASSSTPLPLPRLYSCRSTTTWSPASITPRLPGRSSHASRSSASNLWSICADRARPHPLNPANGAVELESRSDQLCCFSWSPPWKASQASRTISTFSCDIVRRVSQGPALSMRSALSRRPGCSCLARCGGYASRCCWRSGEIRTTFHARPSRCIAQMIAPDGSSSQRRRPWTAERGKAWWLWCQASPSESEREPPDVGRAVVGGEAAAAVEVADRVDRPGDVVDEEDPHQPAPEQPGERAGERAREQPAEREREPERQADERDEAAVEQPHAAVVHQVGRVLAAVGLAVGVEEPADVRVPEAGEAAAVADVRASGGRPPRRCGRGACGGRRPSRSPGPGPPSSPRRRARTRPACGSERRGG